MSFGGQIVKGIEVSVPILDYKRVWSPTPGFTGHIYWQTKNQLDSHDNVSFSNELVSTTDPIQKVAIAALVDIMYFATWRVTTDDQEERSIAIPVIHSLHKFLTEVVPTSVGGPYANELASYSLTEANEAWQRYEQVLLNAPLSGEEPQQTPQTSESVVAQEVTDDWEPFEDPHANVAPPWEEFFQQAYGIKPDTEDDKNTSKLSELLQLAYPGYEIEISKEFRGDRIPVVIMPLFIRHDMTAEEVALFFAKDGIWWSALGAAEDGFVQISMENPMFVDGQEVEKALLQAHLVIFDRITEALSGMNFDMSVVDIHRARNLVELTISSLGAFAAKFDSIDPVLAEQFRAASAQARRNIEPPSE